MIDRSSADTNTFGIDTIRMVEAISVHTVNSWHSQLRIGVCRSSIGAIRGDYLRDRIFFRQIPDGSFYLLWL